MTVQAVFGRPVNIYWDGRHGWDALQLSLEAVPGWQVGLGVAVSAAGLVLMFRLVRWSMTTLSALAFQGMPRPVLAGMMLALLASAISFAAYEPNVRDTRWFFSLPVTPTLVRQARLVRDILRSDATGALAQSPSFSGNVARLHGADLLLVFAESYGATTFDDPVKAAALQPVRATFMAAIESSGRGVVSARVRSPTFAGGSWLAHAALLSGIDTRDPGTYDVLLASKRPTLVSHFESFGYRTVGWMPGLQKPWPEGAFYGYERIASANSIGYAGLEFGYWRIPDQAAIGLLGEQELGKDIRNDTGNANGNGNAGANNGGARKPRFVVFPTLGTHVPFRPLAPYIDDWSRVTRPDGYSPTQLQASMAAPVTWKDAVPAYVESMQYQFEWLGGYLLHRAPHHMLMIVIGDHQPLAAVSGQNASWDVPVHIVSDDPSLLAHFARHGFTPGLTPPTGTLSTMSELTRLLLEVFSDPSG